MSPCARCGQSVEQPIYHGAGAYHERCLPFVPMAGTERLRGANMTDVAGGEGIWANVRGVSRRTRGGPFRTWVER